VTEGAFDRLNVLVGQPVLTFHSLIQCAAGRGPDESSLRPALRVQARGLDRTRRDKAAFCSEHTPYTSKAFQRSEKKPPFLNWGANKLVGEYEDGGFFSDLWKAFEVYGVCSSKRCLIAPSSIEPSRLTRSAGRSEDSSALGCGTTGLKSGMSTLG